MIVALAVSSSHEYGAAIAIVGLAVAVAAAWLAWQRAPLRATPVRVAIAVTRGLLVALFFALLADPVVTREVERRPTLRIVWDERAPLDVADAPGGATRREALEAALDAAIAAGLEERYEIVDVGDTRRADATLMLTDGFSAAIDGGERDGVVAALVPAREESIPDLSILEASVPSHAAPGAPITVRVVVRARGAAGRTIVVTVSDGARVIGSSSVEVASADEAIALDVAVVPQSTGMQQLAIDVAGLTGEVSLDDNHVDRWIDLEGEVRRVLFVEGEPTWEGKFVRRALERDPTLRVDYVARVSKEAFLAQPELEEEETPKGWDELRDVLGDRARLFGYSAVILGPLDGGLVDASGSARLVEFVDARGGGLVVLGANGFPGSILANRTLATVMPAEVPSSSLVRSEGGAATEKPVVLLRPAEGVEGHAVFAPLGVEPAAKIEKLRRMGRGYLKLGALRPGAEALAVDGELGSVLIAAHEYGEGRSAIVAPSDTWRLALGAPEEVEAVAAKLWSGIVSWAAARAEAPDVVRVAESAVAVGREAVVEVGLRDAAYSPRTSSTVTGTARLVDPARADAEAIEVGIDFGPIAEAPGWYRGSFVPGAAGTWEVSVAAEGRARGSVRVRASEAAAGERVAPDPSARARFVGVVRARGGDVVATSDVARLGEALPGGEMRRVVDEAYPARHVAWAFVLPLLFCVEIFLRRRYGLD